MGDAMANINLKNWLNAEKTNAIAAVVVMKHKTKVHYRLRKPMADSYRISGKTRASIT